MSSFLENDGLSIELLRALSFKSMLGLSLKNTIRKFSKDSLLKEIEQVICWYDEQDVLMEIPLDYRIKSLHSASLKYDRHYPDRPAAKVFNDLLGFRALCDGYDEMLQEHLQDGLRSVDMTNGKANSDGYRGVHVYYQLDNFHYPIEIQYNTYYDRQFNNWLHKYVYKKNFDCAIGEHLRIAYECGKIRNEGEFKEAVDYAVRCGKEL